MTNISNLTDTKLKNNHIFNLFLLTFIFNFWFPKAGIKISNIPLTIGNVLFAFLFIVWSIDKIAKRKNIMINELHILLFINILYCIIKYIIIGNFKTNIGYIIPLIIYPLMYIVSYDIIDSYEKKTKLFKYIEIGFYFITIYALIQYIFGIDKVSIPGLTVNLSDYNNYGKYWYLTKSNGTDISQVKIVSTYQNGNLFGVNLLLFYPIIFEYYKINNKYGKIFFSLALFILVGFLTLSRTVWFGIVLFLISRIFFMKSKSKLQFLVKYFIILMLILTIPLIFGLFPSISSRFLNTNKEDWFEMSGRTQGLIDVANSMKKSNSFIAYLIGPAGVTEYSGLAYEMTLLSIFVQIGLIGVFLLYSFYFIAISKSKKNDYFDIGIRVAIKLWLIYGLIEGGYWLPPTIINIFMLIGILKNKRNTIKVE